MLMAVHRLPNGASRLDVDELLLFVVPFSRIPPVEEEEEEEEEDDDDCDDS